VPARSTSVFQIAGGSPRGGSAHFVIIRVRAIAPRITLPALFERNPKPDHSHIEGNDNGDRLPGLTQDKISEHIESINHWASTIFAGTGTNYCDVAPAKRKRKIVCQLIEALRAGWPEDLD
jgi:hypothetical protein